MKKTTKPTASDWDKSPRACFELFLASPAFVATLSRDPDTHDRYVKPASAVVYRAMFNKFCTYMEDHHLKMSRLTSTQLFEFLSLSSDGKEADVQSLMARRYLRLVERCYRYMGTVANPARAAVFDAIREKKQIGKDRAMVALHPSGAAAFATGLPPPTTWKKRRSRAMLMTFLYAGIKVATAVGLKKSEVKIATRELDGAIELEITPEGKAATIQEHTTWLIEPGATELANWLLELEQLNIPGDLVFPANVKGVPLNKATVFRQVRTALQQAGLDAGRLGGRTLRNTYAVNALESLNPSQLRQLLGLKQEKSVETYVATRERLLAPATSEANVEEPRAAASRTK